MYLIDYFLTFTNNFVENVLYVANKNKSSTIEIGFSQIKGDRNKNVNLIYNYLHKNKVIFKCNMNELLRLSEKENLNKENVDNMLRKTIDNINSKFVFHIVNSDNIDCSNIYEISHIIYRINNSLFDLGKEIDLYNIKEITDLRDISKLTKLTLGKEKIPEEYRDKNINGYLSFDNKSYGLFNLIYTFTGIDGVMNYVKKNYKKKSKEHCKIKSVLRLID